MSSNEAPIEAMPVIKSNPQRDRLPDGFPAWLTWQLLAAAALMLMLGLRARGAFWEWNPDVLIAILSLGVTHLLASGALYWRLLRRGDLRAIETVMAVVLAYALWSLLLYIARFTSFTSRPIVVVALLGSGLLLSLPLLLPKWFYRSAVLILALGAAGVSLVHPSGALHATGTEDDTEEHRSSFESTLVHMVSLDIHEDAVPSAATGGGVQVLGAGVLAAAGDGGLYYLLEDHPGGELSSQKLPYRVPINREEFLEDTDLSGFDAEFRVADILVQTLGERFRLFASHHYWHRRERCSTVRVSQAEAPVQTFLAGSAQVRWRTLYETKPCLPLLSGDHPFVGIQIGGRMVQLGPQTILLAVGDMGFDGWNSDRNLPQDPSADYGKTIRIQVETGQADIYTSGHRNPQGLHITLSGQVWLTEHGPQGGDELNLLTRGHNYGWPFVTYGTDYGLMNWPLSEEAGSHAGYTRPVFAWIPSIGVSDVVSVQNDLFNSWHEDLLIASLREQTLFRARIRDGRVIFAEPIIMGVGRIRSLVEAADGRIVMLLDGGSVAWMGLASAVGSDSGRDRRDLDAPVQAARLFASCQGCHSIGDGFAHGIGPDLRGIVGREVASAPGFRYSSALANLSGPWTAERLDQFLANPRAYVPGTSMRVHPIYSAESRRILIEYLASQ